MDTVGERRSGKLMILLLAFRRVVSTKVDVAPIDANYGMT
jgi:hypothetical protein